MSSAEIFTQHAKHYFFIQTVMVCFQHTHVCKDFFTRKYIEASLVPDMRGYPHTIFSYFFAKTYVVGTI